jgi:hypothetical protein
MIRLRRLGGQRGQVLVIFGLSCVALFAVLALAIDGGRFLMDQRALQNAADGASLLAASDIGPGASDIQQGWAEDDAVLSVERSLSIDFSNNYPGEAHRLIGGLGACAQACSPPWGPTACCTNWTDTTGTYLLSIRTPLAFGSAEPEAVVQVRLTHHMSLMVGGNLWPQIDVNVQSTARNYAVPYAIFTFKHNDNTDLDQTGGASLTANKRIGSNGTASRGSMTFTCTGAGAGQWGGDYHSFSANNGAGISGTKETTCPAPGSAATNVVFGPNVANYILPPTVHLPDDPCLLSPNPCGAAQAVQGPLTVAGTQMLVPTIPADPTRPLGPRYSTVTVNGAGNVLYLEPGVYFFEGTATGSGLQILSGGAVVTGDCYAAGGPTFPNCSSTAVCGLGMSALAGSDTKFYCGAGNDMGVLLVFWPAGPALDPVCVPSTWPTGNLAYPFCLWPGAQTSGAYNELHIQGQGNLYISSSPRYHSVVIFVDPKHATSAWNFTTAATLPPGFSTPTDAGQLGNGSNVVYVQGGGNISVVGATYAPEDSLFLGGATGGKGYGQLLAYYIHYQGNAAIVESYNPLALVYAPVIVR